MRGWRERHVNEFKKCCIVTNIYSLLLVGFVFPSFPLLTLVSQDGSLSLSLSMYIYIIYYKGRIFPFLSHI